MLVARLGTDQIAGALALGVNVAERMVRKRGVQILHGIKAGFLQ
jgi:hypothetical protein